MFPEKTRFLKRPIGWEDLGIVKGTILYDKNIKKNVENIEIHSFCKTRTKIGRDNNGIFKFCPRCLIKLKG